ncbi:hypothetical protein OH76DRAFT_550275 [Lentinus brumalis]|uniref:Uncharacterized protein n=1 Tax=Lentinus brumalis TaxID=2498619 RepID=A0A371D9Y9_9APHY|nr:hypothetical protein OH76DRAFT_550275 [Polyporus brumalis]
MRPNALYNDNQRRQDTGEAPCQRQPRLPFRRSTEVKYVAGFGDGKPPAESPRSSRSVLGVQRGIVREWATDSRVPSANTTSHRLWRPTHRDGLLPPHSSRCCAREATDANASACQLFLSPQRKPRRGEDASLRGRFGSRLREPRRVPFAWSMNRKQLARQATASFPAGRPGSPALPCVLYQLEEVVFFAARRMTDRASQMVRQVPQPGAPMLRVMS